MRSAYFILGNTFVPRSGGGGEGGWWCWLVDLVLMLEQKTMRKGTFFQAGQCAALSSFRIRKTAF